MNKLVALAAFAAGCATGGSDRALADVQLADLVVSVEVTGELAAVDSTDVKPPVLRERTSFNVTALAAEGAEVAIGDPLVTFDPTELNRQLESLQSDAAEAQQRLAKRRDEITLSRREDELHLMEAEAGARKAKLKIEVPPDLVASLELRSQNLDNELAQIALDQAKRAAAYARQSEAAELADLEETRVHALRRIDEVRASIAKLSVAAPRAGTVVYVVGYRGEKRKIGDSVFDSEPIVQIVGLGAMIGTGRVDEVDLGHIAVHQPVTLHLDALADVEVHGTLQAITADLVPRSDTDPSKVARVEIAVAPERGTALRPGMRFRGQIELERLPHVVQVPADAVFIGPSGPIAYRDDGGSLDAVPLVLGRRSAQAIQVVSGLAAGDRVSRVAPDQEER